MSRTCPVVVALLMTLAACAHAANVPLRSNRNAKAEVAEINAGGLRVKVSFLPVTTLTEVANERISQMMAQTFAEQAVRFFLKTDKGIRFSRVRTESFRLESTGSATCTVVYAIPKSALADVEVVKAGSDELVSRRSFEKIFATEGRQVIEDFRSSCYQDLRVAESAFLLEIGERTRDSDALRREIEEAFSAMSEKAKADDMLLLSEQEELVKKIRFVKSHLLNKLNKGGASNDEPDPDKIRENAKLISKGDFRNEAYKRLLLSDAVLLKTGGCRTFNADGKLYIVAVGGTEVRNDTPRDRIRRKEIAQEKARTEVVKSKRTDVMSFSKLSSRAEVKYENGVEQSQDIEKVESVATAKAVDHVDDMDIVATWYSIDGKMYFLALGYEDARKKNQ